MTKAVIYCRFSPRPDGDLSESNDVQLGYCTDYCLAHNYETDPARCFSDAESSGDDEDRPGLWGAVAAVKRGMVLVAWKGDRLARSVYLDEAVRREVAQQGGRVEIVTGTRNGESPEDVCVRQIFAVIAEMEKKVSAARTRAFMLRYQASGRAMSKIPPYGTQNGQPVVVVDRSGRQHVRQTLVANEAELATVERIVALDRKGMSRRRIARELAAEGIRARSGRRFDHKTIGRIIARAGG